MISLLIALGFAVGLAWTVPLLRRAQTPAPDNTSQLKPSLAVQVRAVAIVLGFIVPIAHVSLTFLNLVFQYRDRTDSVSWPSLALIILVVHGTRYFWSALTNPPPELRRAAIAAYIASALFIWGRSIGWFVLPYVHQQ